MACEDPFVLHIPRMVLASLGGFAVASQFVSLEGLELPYYIALLGAAALKVADYSDARVPMHPAAAPHWTLTYPQPLPVRR